MNLDALVEYGIPAVIGAGSALVSVYMANRFAAKQQERDFMLRQKELDQRLIETLIPIRLTALTTVFNELQTLKDGKRSPAEIISAIEPHLIWLDDNLGKGIASVLGDLHRTPESDELRSKLTRLQETCRIHCGATRLNCLLTRE